MSSCARAHPLDGHASSSPTPALASPKRRWRGSDVRSSRSKATSPGPITAPASASPLPNRSPSCMAGRCASAQRRAEARSCCYAYRSAGRTGTRSSRRRKHNLAEGAKSRPLAASAQAQRGRCDPAELPWVAHLHGILLTPDGVLRERAARLGYRVRPFGGVDVAVGIDGHALARRALIHPVVAFERWDEPGDAVLVDRADADAVTPVRVVVWARLRVDHVDRVAPDEEATGTAEHIARLKVRSVLIENLDAVVAAIGHPQAAASVERQRVRRAELAVTHADSAPRLDELPVGRELADARCCAALDALGDGVRGDHALCFVSIGHIDAAVGADDNVVRLVELTVGVAGLARDAQAQQLLTLRAELVDLMPLGACLVTREISDPHVAPHVHGDAVRRNHDALAEVRQHRAGLAIELEDGIDRRVVAVDGTTAGGSRAAALVGPDVAVDGIDVDAGRGDPLAAGRQLTQVGRPGRSAVSQSLRGG